MPTFFATLVVLACTAMLLRLCIGERRRRRLDARLRWIYEVARQIVLRLWRLPAARRAAREAIRRAKRNGASHADNVVRPDAFKGPRKPH